MFGLCLSECHEVAFRASAVRKGPSARAKETVPGIAISISRQC
jgi:hypothetical protein